MCCLDKEMGRCSGSEYSALCFPRCVFKREMFAPFGFSDLGTVFNLILCER